MDNKKKLAEKVKRTNNLIEVGKRLSHYRDQIDDIIRVINSGEEFHSEIADQCIEIGVTFQSLSSLLRPFSIEGKEKIIINKIKSRWRSKCRKANTDWIKKYADKSDFYRVYKFKMDFIRDYCSDIVPNLEEFITKFEKTGL